MSGYDLTEAVEAAVQALRAAGLADADGCGYVLENVYADGAVHVALTAALPHLEQQIREQVAKEIERLERSVFLRPNDSDYRIALAQAYAYAARIARTRKDTDHD